MQGNNNLRIFSSNSNNRYTDTEIDTLSAIADGPGAGAVADSKLYNSLSLTVTLATVSLIDFIALNNPGVTFGQSLSIDDWISSVNNTLMSKSEIQNNFNATNQEITKIKNGTTTVPSATNSSNVTTTINGVAITSIFENNGTTVKKSTTTSNITDNSTSTNYKVRVLTQSEYDNLVSSGTIDNTTIYFIKEG